MQALARERGGRCLSDTYVNSATKLLWQCARGHTWSAKPNSIRSCESWCPYCAGLARRTIEDMHALARERGGRCLSDTYVNNATKLRWACADGHEWSARPLAIRQGHWCPRCAGRARLTLEDMRAMARERGGLCLSKRFVTSKLKLRWQCAEGHRWNASPNHMRARGTWCPHCFSVSRTLQRLTRVANDRGGTLLSKSYLNARGKLRWQCAQGHVWSASADAIDAGLWCPRCPREQTRITIADVRASAFVVHSA